MTTTRVVGVESVTRNLRAFPGEAQKEIRQSMGQVILKLERLVKQGKLTGQVLHVRTGRLRRSIHSRITEDRTSVTGIVGTNVEYAAVHEYGYTGPQTVKEHLRTIKQAFGKTITPTTVTVAAHTRTVKLPERSFLRSALDEMSSEIRTTLQDSLTRSIQKWST